MTDKQAIWKMIRQEISIAIGYPLWDGFEAIAQEEEHPPLLAHRIAYHWRP